MIHDEIVARVMCLSNAESKKKYKHQTDISIDYHPSKLKFQYKKKQQKTDIYPTSRLMV